MIENALTAALNNKGAHAARLRIVYNNDTHKSWDNIAREINGVRQYRRQGDAQGEDVLTLNAGDNNTGENIGEWNLSVRLMNLFGLTATTPGNHEQDVGTLPYASALAKWAVFPTLVSNLVVSPAGQQIKTILQAAKIRTSAMLVQGKQACYGLIGITSTKNNGSQGDQGDISVQDFDTTCQTVQTQIRQLKQQGAQGVIVLSHMGLTSDQQLAHRVSGINAIVGGDDHEALPGLQPGKNLIASPTGAPVLITNSGGFGAGIGVADLTINPQGENTAMANTIVPSRLFPEDPQAEAILNESLPKKSMIAYLTQDYTSRNNTLYDKASHRPNAQAGQDPLAQLTADTARQLTRVDIALIRSSEIRKPISQGWLSSWELQQLMPYDDPLVCSTATGKEIVDALRQYTSHGRLLYGSGLAYAINTSKPGIENVRVQNPATQTWSPLLPDRTYTIAMGEYGFQSPVEVPPLAHPERIYARTGLPAREVLTQGLKALGAPNRPVALPTPDQRIQVITGS